MGLLKIRTQTFYIDFAEMKLNRKGITFYQMYVICDTMISKFDSRTKLISRDINYMKMMKKQSCRHNFNRRCELEMSEIFVTSFPKMTWIPINLYSVQLGGPKTVPKNPCSFYVSTIGNWNCTLKYLCNLQILESLHSSTKWDWPRLNHANQMDFFILYVYSTH